MDFRTLGIDERLLAGVPALRDQSPFHEKMLSHAFIKGENVCARLAISAGREYVYLLPALQWLVAGAEAAAGRARVLCLLPDAEDVASVVGAAKALGTALELEPCVATLSENGEAALDGDPGSRFVAGSLQAIIAAAPVLHLKEFGYLLVDGAERIAELPSEIVHRLSAALLPSRERHTIVVCGKLTVKARNLAWDLADNPIEIQIEEEAAKAQSVEQETWHIASDNKLRFLLGLLARRKPSWTCVFCNLKSGAEELALRLRYDGLEADYILGSLPAAKKAAIVAGIEGEFGSVLVLTDEGAAGIPPGRFPLVVNYDIPLDPELYVKRLEMLDRTAPSAHVANLACDRYVYGLPAVEQHIDARLNAAPVTEDLLLAEDKSADLVFERPHFDRDAPRGAGPRMGRLLPAVEAQGGPHGSTPSEHGRRDRQYGRHGRGERDGRPAEGRRGAPRDSSGWSDRSPEIRKSISDITGVSFDREAARPGDAAEAQRKAGPQQGPKNGAEGGQHAGGGKPAERPAGRAQNSGHRSGKGGHAGARGPAAPDGRSRSPKAGRPAGGRPAAGRPAGKTPFKTAPHGQGPSSQGGANPYDLPMEDRMKLYREKYGQNVDGVSKKPAAGARTKHPSDQGRSRPKASPGGGGAANGAVPEPGQARRPQAKPASEGEPLGKNAETTPKRKSLLDRILGGRKKPN